MSNENQTQVAVINSVRALLGSYESGKALHTITSDIEKIIRSEQEGFLNRIALLDGIIEKNPDYQPLEELLFDLLMVHFLAAEQHKEDYFDSPEWNEIENKTLDRGSEMLNLFLYISEANETEVQISMDDFLNEFLLVNEDEFQDEHRIYESLIENEDLLDLKLSELRQVQKSVKEDTGIQDYFISIVLFFQYVEGVLPQSKMPEGLNSVEEAIFDALNAFNYA